MKNTIGFIGCGNMGSALVRAVAAANCADGIYIYDKDEEKTAFLKSEMPELKISDPSEITGECRFIFIGVKPQVIKPCLEEIKDGLKENSVLVSMAAGVAIEDIVSITGKDKIIRIMPNLPVALGKGVVMGAYKGISDEEKRDFGEAMSKAGVFDWLPENLIDAGGAVSGCGPAYGYMFIEALADGAVVCGLPRDKALLYAAGMLSGACEMVLKSGKHPEKLKDEVCSPGGTTIAGVAALENGCFRGTVINAVTAAYRRTGELSKH